MNAVSTDFLQLIRSYLWGETPRLRRPDWDGLYELARIHNLTPMIYEAAQGLPAFVNASEAVKHAFLESTLQMIVGQQRRTGLLFHIYQKLTDAGLRPLVLKGLVCRLLYPEPDARVSSDEDLWIAPHEFAACDRILSENGFTQGLRCNRNVAPRRANGGVHFALFGVGGASQPLRHPNGPVSKDEQPFPRGFFQCGLSDHRRHGILYAAAHGPLPFSFAAPVQTFLVVWGGNPAGNGSAAVLPAIRSPA